MSVLNTMPWQSSGTDEGWVDYLDGYERYLSVCKYRVETLFDGSMRFLLIYGQRNSDDKFTLRLPENMQIPKNSRLDFPNGVLSDFDGSFTFSTISPLMQNVSYLNSLEFPYNGIHHRGTWFMGIFQVVLSGE